MSVKENFRIQILLPIFIALYEGIIYLSNDMYLPALPTIQKDFNATTMEIQNSLTFWFLGAGTLQLIVGPLSDKYGKRPILFGGALIFILGLAICVIPGDINLFLLGRYMQGLVVPTCIVTGYAILHEYLSTKKAIQAIAWMGSITILSPAIGPLVGSVVLLKGEWQIIFWMLLAVTIIPIVGLYKLMPESKHVTLEKDFNFRKILQNYRSLFSNKSFFSFSLTAGVSAFPLIAWLVVGPFLVMEKYHMTENDFAICQLVIFGAYVVGCIFVKIFTERMSINAILDLGLIICLLSGIIGIIFNFIFLEYGLEILVIFLAIFAIGDALVFAISSRMAIEATEQQKGLVVSGFSMIVSTMITLASLTVSEIYRYNIAEFLLYMVISALIIYMIFLNLRYKAVNR